MRLDENLCPFCAETIKAAAVKCRFCGASLPSSSASFSASARLDESEILDLLSHLADKSLVVYEEHADGSGRYRLLETVRQYARDRLFEADEGERLRRRHREFFSRFWQDAAPGLSGPEQAAWLARLDAEYDNLRAALELSPAAAPTDIHDCLALASAAFVFCNMRGRFSEPRAWLTHLLAAQSETGSDATRGRALNAVGSLAWRQGDYDVARTFLEEARTVAEFGRFGRADGRGQQIGNTAASWQAGTRNGGTRNYL